MAKKIRIKPILLTACFVLGLSLLSIDTIDFIKPTNISEQSKSNGSTSSTSVAIENSISADTDIDIKETEELKSTQNDEKLVATSRGSDVREKAEAIKEINSSEKKSEPVVTQASKPSAAVKTETITTTKTISSAEISKDTSAELDLLARLITAEAQAEPYEAQVAVGAVVLNRVESSDWPNTIYSVIYQNINGYIQFTPVENGWIDKPAQPESIEAAKAALSGVDPTNGAEFYYDDTTTNTWILSKPVSTQIGHMIYAY